MLWTCSPCGKDSTGAEYAGGTSGLCTGEAFRVKSAIGALTDTGRSVFQANTYPCVSKVVKACLSIFGGPQIEQSFSAMNDTGNKKMNWMDTRYLNIKK